MDERTIEIMKLKNHLCFPLYACSREAIKLYKPLLDELNLTYTQYITMLVLWERKQVTVKELGIALYLDSGTLTPLLKKLEDKGLVNRRRSALDERNLLVSLTPAGVAMQERATHIPTEMEKCVNLNQEERVTLYRLLYKMLAYLDNNQ